ncbi:MAG: DNA-directed RNA polymerase subunit K [Candidatus Aenigmatarchaeota archaeon]
MTRFEKARVVGARALQISMGAPALVDLKKKTEFPRDIARREFEKDVIPLTVKRKMPPKME